MEQQLITTIVEVMVTIEVSVVVKHLLDSIMLAKKSFVIIMSHMAMVKLLAVAYGYHLIPNHSQ